MELLRSNAQVRSPASATLVLDDPLLLPYLRTRAGVCLQVQHIVKRNAVTTDRSEFAAAVIS